jgi:hypothetical protein
MLDLVGEYSIADVIAIFFNLPEDGEKDGF